MAKFALVTVRIDVEEDAETPTNEQMDSLEHWVSGTFDNAQFDEDVGFPGCFEGYAMVIGATLVVE